MQKRDETDDPTLQAQDASKTVVADIDPDGGRLTVRSATTGRLLLDVPLDPQIDVLGSRDDATVVQSVEVTRGKDEIRATLSYSSAVWAAKVVHVSITANTVTYRVEVTGNDLRITDARLLASTTAPGRTLAVDVYVPRFDWFEAQVRIPTDADDTLAAQQWLSPPPLVYVFGSGAESFWVAAAPRPGAFTMHSFDYTGSQGVSFRLTYEGHTRVDGTYSLPEVVIGFGDGDGNAGVRAAVGHLRATGRLPEPSPRPIPAWWREPIFCGWGQMRFDYRRDHAGHENGTFINVTSYCTELRYRNYLAALDEAGVDPGTIVIDMGWAKDPALGLPDPDRWGDMRAFIDEQHARGRRVLLWYAPVVHQGLPTEACMTLDGVPVAPDPTSAAYASILAEQVRLMISPDPGCLDADGFKIDFTQCVASESGRFVSRIPHFGGLINETDESLLYPRLGEGRDTLISTRGEAWGIELIRLHLELLHGAAHRIKPDAMIMSHAANPYLEDVIDVLRLNDLDGDCDDVLGVMGNRAELARICSPNWLIDTDDDLMIDRRRWLAYAELQPLLGIPDTYYATGIAHSQERLTGEDHARLRQIWDRYRRGLEGEPTTSP